MPVQNPINLIFLAVKDKNKLDTDASNLRDKEKVCHQFVHDIARGNVSIPDIAVSFNIKEMYAKIAKQAKSRRNTSHFGLLIRIYRILPTENRISWKILKNRLHKKPRNLNTQKRGCAVKLRHSLIYVLGDGVSLCRRFNECKDFRDKYLRRY